MTRPETSDHPSDRRLHALDGLRGVAILAVVAYHYLSRFPGFYPYGDGFTPIARYGYLGVELFFVISGFVIALTLERSAGIVQFAVRRFLRLWPPILVCSILTFLTMHLIETDFTAARRTGLSGFVPSLTFISPTVLDHVIPGVRWIDGVYWSLFVEVRFYFWAALTVFVLRLPLAPTFIGAGLAFGIAGIVTRVPAEVEILFAASYLPLFAIGITAYQAWRGAMSKVGATVVITALIAVQVLAESQRTEELIPLIILGLVVLPFFGLVTRSPSLRPLETGWLVWIGRRSYSLYLLHQNIGVAFLTLLPSGLGLLSYGVAIAATVSAMLMLSDVIYRLVETRARRALEQRLPGHFDQRT